MGRVPAVLLLLFLIPGCYLEGLLDTDPSALAFTVESADHGAWLEQPVFEIAAGVRQISVVSTLSAPNPCQRLDGEMSRAGSRVTLRVRIIGEGEACVAMIGTFRYTAVISGLSPGTYQLRVIHEYPATGWPSGPVLERNVAVR